MDTDIPQVSLRPLERSDLHFVHVLNNNRSVMGYWFEEPYESFVELEQLYEKHIHDQSERRFIVVHLNPAAQTQERVGLVELLEIDQLHRRAEFLIMTSPGHEGHGYAKAATRAAINYAFRALNLYKLYLLVDVDNAAAIHIYEGAGFEREGVLRDEFFSEGRYHDVVRMCIFQHQVLGPARPAEDAPAPVPAGR